MTNLSHPPSTSNSQPLDVDRQAGLTEFTSDELLAELIERARAGAFGWLADLLRQAQAKAQAAADPELRRKHAALYWALRAELRDRAML